MQEAMTNQELADVDMAKLAAIKQKRTLAFVNHFVATNIQFLNSFAKKCDSMLMAFERKMEKIEAAMILLEERLSSIPELNTAEHSQKPIDTNKEPITKEQIKEEISTDSPNQNSDKSEATVTDSLLKEKGPENPESNEKVSPEYERFIKMVQVGVPLEAVKLKVGLEGLDPNIFVKINKIPYHRIPLRECVWLIRKMKRQTEK